ncbi:MAG: hypothetical protein EBU84_18745, partial [Actinobacteria bacterium]|nr:hypothetical protein [Actinomycetota bacterium]
ATSGGVLNDAGCIQDPQDPSVSRRVYDINSDQDGDGIPDIKEDSNLNCIQDAGETLPTNPDTDDDGLTDGLETCTKKVEATCEATDPLNKYSDGDLLTDGEEDANHNGVHGLADNETDPNVTDTDKDGFSDSDEVTKYGTSPLNPDTDGDGYPDGDKVNEKCPMIPGNENCYYANCIPVDSAVVDAAVSEGEDAGNAIDCDNTDGDGICSQVEDKNGNCQYDPGETDATKADTDGDGISDGTEDLNLNGKVDSTESSPIKADTDGDCIPDNLEDKDGDGHFNLEGGETSAYLTDSDGDGLPDGRGTSITDSEDYNCNGTVDDGETKPYLADTDGDGKEDATDVCPWETNGSCVVRYCGVNGYADYDTDGDGLPDSVEDLNGDCMWTRESKEPDPRVGDTDADGLTDGQEVQCYSTNPVSADTDGDGKSDSEEVSASVAGGQCTLMYNLGDNNPVKPQYSCALNTQEATLDATVTIISMVGFLALGLVLR